MDNPFETIDKIPGVYTPTLTIPFWKGSICGRATWERRINTSTGDQILRISLKPRQHDTFQLQAVDGGGCYGLKRTIRKNDPQLASKIEKILTKL